MKMEQKAAKVEVQHSSFTLRRETPSSDVTKPKFQDYSSRRDVTEIRISRMQTHVTSRRNRKQLPENSCSRHDIAYHVTM